MSDPHGAQVPDVHGASTAVEGPHGSAADHADGHGHDDHGHGETALGPVDWPMWGAGVLGVAIALVMSWIFLVSAGI